MVVAQVMSKFPFILGGGGGGSGGGLGENSCSNEGTVFCSHRKFSSDSGCRDDIIKYFSIYRSVDLKPEQFQLNFQHLMIYRF